MAIFEKINTLLLKVARLRLKFFQNLKRKKAWKLNFML